MLPATRPSQLVWLGEQTPLLKDTDYRQQLVRDPALDWSAVRALWSSLAAQPDADDALSLVDALARFSRNCCVEEEGRRELLPAHDALRSILRRFSSYQLLSDRFYQPALQALTQFLANLANSPETAAVVLPAVVNEAFDKNVVVRLLASEDDATLIGVVTFLYLALDNVPELSSLFVQGTGLSIVDILLRKLEKWFEAAEEGETSRCASLGYEVLKVFCAEGHVSTLYRSLADGIASSPISLTQFLLLKFFDAYLHSPATSFSPALLSSDSLAFLLPTASQLLAELLRPMRALRAGGEGSKTPFAEEGFGKCYEGFTLVLKGVIYVALLRAKDEAGVWEREAGARVMDELAAGDFLASALELLALSDVYEPRLVRAAPSPSGEREPVHAFAPLRKDVVRLLGIYAASSRGAQDRLAGLGAIEQVLGMCALDVQNPLLREHSLFAIRSLLLNNAENQSRVKELEPQATIDEDGQVGEVPDRWRK